MLRTCDDGFPIGWDNSDSIPSFFRMDLIEVNFIVSFLSPEGVLFFQKNLRELDIELLFQHYIIVKSTQFIKTRHYPLAIVSLRFQGFVERVREREKAPRVVLK